MIRALLLAAVLVPPGCEGAAPQGDLPAVMTHPTAKSRAELLRTIREAMNGVSVTIAEDALTRDSVLIIEHAEPRDERGLPLSGRVTGKPEQFQLVQHGSHCELVQQSTGKRWTLTSATCAPLSPPRHSVVPLAEAHFTLDEDVTCLQDALLRGDPDTGASTFALKAKPGCVVPWHSHTAQEQLIVVSGEVLTEMEGMRPAALGPGGFASMLSREKHQFTCSAAGDCLLFVSFDRKYDIFWLAPRK